MKGALRTKPASRACEPAALDIYKRAVSAAERQHHEPSVDDIHKLARRAL